MVTNLVMMEKGKMYESPQVEIIEVEVEKGFAASDMNVEEGEW